MSVVEELPNLWPIDTIKVEVLTPAVILRAQASYLEKATRGILRADVRIGNITDGTEPNVEISFDIIAPALNSYRHTIIVVSHKVYLVYPATITAIGRRLEEDRFGEVVESGPTTLEASNDEQLKILLTEIFRSNEVTAIIQSLIARSNEETAS